MKKAMKRILIGCMAVLLVLNASVAVEAAGDSVSIQVDQDDLLDIVLTVGQTDSAVSTFGTDLTQALVSKGVPANKINIQAVEASEVSAGNTTSGWEIYDHTNNSGNAIPYYRPYYNEVNGNYVLNNHISPVVNGSATDIEFFGYGAPGYKDFMYMPNSESGKKTFEFTIQEGSFYDALNGAGFLFNTSMTSSSDLANRTMSGYLVFFDYIGSASPPTIEIYRYSNINVNTFHNGTNTPIPFAGLTKIAYHSVGTEKTRTVKIEATNSVFKMWYNGGLVNWNLTAGGTATDVPLNVDYGSYGFGPMVGYLDHGCGQPTHFTFYSVRMSTESSKRFSEVIREPQWRNESKRFIINAEDGAVSDFSDPVALGEILSRLGNEHIGYIGWGRNDADGNAFISKNNGNGTFIDKDAGATDTYNEQVQAMAAYIYNQYVDGVQNNIEYLIYGKPSAMSITPQSEQTNTIDAQWPSGKWRVDQNENYYDNPTGAVPYDNIYLNNLDISFTEAGKYDIYYKDELVKTVYVHRKPVAAFSLSVDGGYNVHITDNAYDPDAESDPDRGIQSVAWEYKETSATSFTSGMPTTFAPNKNYLVKQVVTDNNGVQSDPYYRYISTVSGAASTPVAEFKVSPSRLLTYQGETVEYTDTSYDPKGESIAERAWTITRDSTQVYTGATPQTNFADNPPGTYPAGTYKITLKVKNASGTWSEEVARFVTVVRDLTAPTAVSDTGNSTSFNVPKVVKLTFADEEGGSGFNRRYAVVTNSTAVPSEWGSMGTNDSVSVTVGSVGANYIHYKAYDYANNERTGYFGPFTIVDNAAPSAPTVSTTPAYTNGTWTNETITVSASGSEDNFTPANSLAYAYSTNGTDFTPGNSVLLDSDGSHTVTFRVTDGSGNSTTASKTVKVDKTAPAVPDITMESDGGAYAENTIATHSVSVALTGGADAGGSGFSKYQYKVDSGDWEDGSAYVFNTSGSYTFAYRAQDIAGNVSEAGSKTVKVDLEAPGEPTISYSPSYTSEWANEPITLTAKLATDNMTEGSAIAYSVSEDNVTFLPGDSVTLSTEGTHTVYFKVTDEGGNSKTVLRTVKIDLTAPAKPDISMKANDTDYAENTWSKYTVTAKLGGGEDTGGSGRYGYQYRIGTGEWHEGDTYTFDVSGVYTLYCRTVDNAGNQSDVGGKTIKVDLDAPATFGITTSATSIDKIDIKAETTDAQSGLSTNAYRVFDGHDWSDWKESVGETLTGYGRGETVTIKVEAKDLAGNVTSAQTTAATLANIAPEAYDDAFTLKEDAPKATLDLLQNDTDADKATSLGDTLTITSLSALSKSGSGKLALVNGVVTFTPATDYNGTTSFTYTVQDGFGGSDTGTATISVTPVNDRPVALNDYADTSYNQGVSIDVLQNDSDVETSDLVLDSVSAPLHGTAAIVNNAVRYTPEIGFTGTDNFSYSVSDGTLQGSGTVSVAVRYPQGFTEGNAVFTPGVTDKEGNPGSTGGVTGGEVTGQPDNGTVSLVDGSYYYTPGAGENGVDSYRVQVEENGQEVEYQVIVNTDAATGQTTTLGYGLPLSPNGFVAQSGSEIRINLADYPGVDWNNVSSISVNGQTVNGSVRIEGNQLVYTPAAGFSGTDGAIITVSMPDRTVPLAATFKVEKKSSTLFSKSMFGWQRLVPWLLFWVLLVLNYLKHRLFYNSKPRRAVWYILLGALVLMVLWWAQSFLGFFVLLPYTLYVAGQYLYARQMQHAMESALRRGRMRIKA